ncbi:hypothetical protein [Zunongwangia sp. H14]|uniref:hypothetical protein n=1 Tax=Zunongwangia sp. H14 TaxID=3240792 RepID=UPI0035630CEF
MKKWICILGFLFCTSLFAQQNNLKNDIIVTTDGQFLQVKVTKVSQDVVAFSYPGESVVNEIPPDAINKIVFASGRTQEFNGDATIPVASAENSAAVSKDVVTTPAYLENTLAVVPLEYEKNGAYEKKLAGLATDYLMGLLSTKSDTLKMRVLPMDKAIEKLLDAGINYSELRESSPEQLRKVMGTEYILYVKINESQKDSTIAGKADYISGAAGSKSLGEIQRNVSLSVYSAHDDMKAFGMDFKEEKFLGETKEGAQTLANSDAWKPSLEYVAGQLTSSPVFSSQ